MGELLVIAVEPFVDAQDVAGVCLLLGMTSHHPASYWLLDSSRDLSVAGLKTTHRLLLGGSCWPVRLTCVQLCLLARVP